MLHFAVKLKVFRRGDTENRVRATAAFKNGSFICEFEDNLPTKEQFEVAGKEYEEKHIQVYGLQVHLILSSLTHSNSCHRHMATTLTPPIV